MRRRCVTHSRALSSVTARTEGLEIGSSSRRDTTVRTIRFAAPLGPMTICQMDRSDPIASLGTPRRAGTETSACRDPIDGAIRAGRSKWNSWSSAPEGRPGQFEDGYVRLPLTPDGHRCPLLHAPGAADPVHRRCVTHSRAPSSVTARTEDWKSGQVHDAIPRSRPFDSQHFWARR